MLVFFNRALPVCASRRDGGGAPAKSMAKSMDIQCKSDNSGIHITIASSERRPEAKCGSSASQANRNIMF